MYRREVYGYTSSQNCTERGRIASKGLLACASDDGVAVIRRCSEAVRNFHVECN